MVYARVCLRVVYRHPTLFTDEDAPDSVDVNAEVRIKVEVEEYDEYGSHNPDDQVWCYI